MASSSDLATKAAPKAGKRAETRYEIICADDRNAPSSE